MGSPHGGSGSPRGHSNRAPQSERVESLSIKTRTDDPKGDPPLGASPPTRPRLLRVESPWKRRLTHRLPDTECRRRRQPCSRQNGEHMTDLTAPKSSSRLRPRCSSRQPPCANAYALAMADQSYVELKARATRDLQTRVTPHGVRSDGSIEAVVAFVDAYARLKSEGAIFDAQKYALWRLFRSLAPVAPDSAWDGVRVRVTRTLEGAGCWERFGGERGQQWWLHHRWGSNPAESPMSEMPTCLRLDEDGLCGDGMDDPRFCSRCRSR